MTTIMRSTTDPPRFAQRARWHALALLCAIPATYLKALHPFMVFLYWNVIIGAVAGCILGPLVDPERWAYIMTYCGAAFVIIVAARYGGEAAQRWLRDTADRYRERAARP